MLQDGNIILRSFKDEDLTPLSTLANNKKIWNNLRDSMPYPYTETDAAFFIHICMQESTPMTFAIEHEDLFCGTIGLVPKDDLDLRTAELGYWIGEPFWNKGIATKAIKLIAEYGFKNLELEKIQASVFSYNDASIKVLLKNGFQRDGIFQNLIPKNKVFYDEYRYMLTTSFL